MDSFLSLPPWDAAQHHAIEARVREALAGAEPERVGPADARGHPEAEVEDLGVPSARRGCFEQDTPRT